MECEARSDPADAHDPSLLHHVIDLQVCFHGEILAADLTLTLGAIRGRDPPALGGDGLIFPTCYWEQASICIYIQLIVVVPFPPPTFSPQLIL